MPNLLSVFNALSLHPQLLPSLKLADLDAYFRLSTHLLDEIRLRDDREAPTSPPYRLPTYIHTFIAKVLELDDSTILLFWDALKDMIWLENPSLHQKFSEEERRRMDECGVEISRSSEKLASVMFYPPIQQCTKCSKRLTSTSRVAVNVFTVNDGMSVHRGYSTSRACKVCKIRYYPNYFVQESQREYYSPSVPAFIQIEDHVYVESNLCEFFTTQMLFAWVSSQNCSNVLNAAISRTCGSESPTHISSEQVFRAFTLNALLREFAEDGICLVLPDVGDNDDRLKAAMEARNRKMILQGQRERMHACNKCEKMISGDGYKGLRSLRAGVADGLTLGRPCCKVHNCSRPLPNNRAHFCDSDDKEHLAARGRCVVNGCVNAARKGSQTCSLKEHIALEEHRNEKGKSFFRLSNLLKRLRGSQLADSMEVDIAGLEAEKDADDPAWKSSQGNRQPKARFQRRRTHNEQLLVSCCGMILARGTMFGAEAISGVKDFLKSVYPNPNDLPDVIFYDNNCQLQSHLRKQKDTHFKHVILPVDVFHFKSKHKETDEFCQKHCNPAQWAELSDGNGKWIFNSSAAEQVNAWMGGYQAMVRDMLGHRYDFFLDEMIKRRNALLRERLENEGHVPYYVPVHRP